MPRFLYEFILADCTDLLLIGARLVLEQNPDVRVDAVAPDAPSLLQLTQQHQPDVVIFDERLSLDHDLWHLMEQLRAAAPCARLVLMCATPSGALTHDLLTRGIDSVLCKYDELQTCLEAAILAVMDNRPYLSPTAMTEYLVAIRDASTNRNVDEEARTVLRLLAQGHPIGQIAYQLQVPLRRVYWVRERLRQDFGAVTNEHLISRAAAEGFILP